MALANARTRPPWLREQLTTEDVERLAERTEGWAAGLYLAGLSLRGRSDPAGFIASFHGDNRHVADYLAAEVLARQPETIRSFLLRTSVLERLSGPLCDAVLQAEGSAERLAELERSNLFLMPLDDHRQWYRYHHLFAQLLGLELGQVAFVAAWIRGHSGASKEETERWLAVVELDGYAGPLPDGVSSLAFGANLARASLLFDDVGRSVAAARRALELAGRQASPFWWMAQSALGHALYLSGGPVDVRPELAELARDVPAAEQPVAVVIALALARRAAAATEAQGLGVEPLCGMAYAVLGRALARQGELTEAEEQLGRALEVSGIDSMLAQRVFALLLLAPVRRGRDDPRGARALVEEASGLIEGFTDPGALPELLDQTVQALGAAPRRRVEVHEPLTGRELAVLRLLPTRLSNREISRELYVSVNTVRSHIQAVYRKLDAGTRAEAVAHAREAGLLAGPAPPGP